MKYKLIKMPDASLFQENTTDWHVALDLEYLKLGEVFTPKELAGVHDMEEDYYDGLRLSVMKELGYLEVVEDEE